MGIHRYGLHAKRQRAPEYRAWLYITEICTNVNHIHYPDFGGNGIGMCAEWLDFKNFIRDMGRRPSPNYVLIRLSEDEDFSKDNCVWVLPQKRKSDINDLARQHNMGGATLRNRIKMGWPLEEALNTPVRAKRPNHGW